MKNFLNQLLTGDLDLLSDELQVEIAEEDVIQGDIGEVVADAEAETVAEDTANVEEVAVIDTTAEQVIEDETTLESLIVGMKAAIARNGALTTEGALFASNHVQSIVKRYNIEFAPQVTTESFAANGAAASQLTLEAAEGAEKSLWARFKQIVSAAWSAIVSFFGSLFRTVESYKKVADSIIARASKTISKEAVEVNVSANAAFFFSSVGAKGQDAKSLVSAANASVVAQKAVAAGLTTSANAVKAAAPTATDDEKAAIEEATAKLTTAFAAAGKVDTVLPFGKVLSVSGTGLSIEASKETFAKEAFKTNLTANDVKAFAAAAKGFLNLAGSYNDAFKAYKAIVDTGLKAGDADGVKGKINKWYTRQVYKGKAFLVARNAAGLSKSAATTLLQLAAAGLKGLEPKAEAKAAK